MEGLAIRKQYSKLSPKKCVCVEKHTCSNIFKTLSKMPKIGVTITMKTKCDSSFIVGGVQSWLQQLDEGLWLGALWVLGDGKGKASLRHS